MSRFIETLAVGRLHPGESGRSSIRPLAYASACLLLFASLGGDLPLPWSRPPVLLADEEPGVDPRVLGEIYLEKRSGAVVVPARVTPSDSGSQRSVSDSVDLRLLLDTGASMSVFDVEHVDKLGPRVGTKVAFVPGGRDEFQTYKPPKVDIRGCSLSTHLEEVAVHSLEAINNDLGEHFDGVLGMDFLRSCVFSIDFDAGVLTFYEKANSTCGDAFQIGWEPSTLNVPMVWALVGGSIDVCCIIDTGAVYSNAGSFDDATYDRLVSAEILQPKGQAKDIEKLNVGTPRVPIARATQFCLLQRHGASARKFGDEALKCSHSGLLFKRLAFKNCLNLGYLSRYIVTFDFPESTLYLRPALCCDGPDSIAATGLTVKGVEDALRVLKVRNDSPGASAGFRKDDLIVAIDDVPLTKQSMFSACRRLAQNGDHTVAMRRAGVTRCEIRVLSVRQK